jgi:DNA-binding MarR family transcriptional regulator
MARDETATPALSGPVTVEDEYLSTPGPGSLFSRLSRVALLLDDFHGRCFSQFGLRFIDYSLLRVLQIAGPPYALSPTRLSEILVRSTGGMTQILDRLERDGLVRRTPDPSDRRKVIVDLTPAGLRLVDAANALYVERKDDALRQVDSAQLDQIDAAVRHLLHLLDGALGRQEAPAV